MIRVSFDLSMHITGDIVWILDENGNMQNISNLNKEDVISKLNNKTYKIHNYEGIIYSFGTIKENVSASHFNFA